MKRKLFVPLILIAFITGISGSCSLMNSELIPEGRGLALMKSYNKLEAAYNEEAAMPNLSDNYKKILVQKRKGLIGLFYAITMYNDYVDVGYVKAETLNKMYEYYVNIPNVPFKSIVEIYEEYVKTGIIDIYLMDSILEDVIKQLTAWALKDIM